MSKITRNLSIIVVCLTLLFGVQSVSAKEVVYTNDNGIELDQYEYNFFKKVYGVKFLKYLDEDVYNQYSDIDFKTVEVESNQYIQGNNLSDFGERGTFFSTAYKSINISKFCGILCRVVTTATWLDEPALRTYDVIGAYLDGPTRTNTPATSVYSTTSTGTAVTNVFDSTGFGAIVDLPDDGEDIVITQSFTYTGTGTIYASYQHTMNTPTLSQAQSFYTSVLGYGSVFYFYNGAEDIYDDMPGVDIDV